MLCGCERRADLPPTPMRVATYYWPGMYWADVAKAKGWVTEAGLDVTFVDTNRDYIGSFKDVIDGRLDTQDFPLFDLIAHNARGADLVMVINTDFSNGADAIVGGPGVASIAALKGKRVGVARGTYHEYILNVVLQREGLSVADVQIIDILAEKAVDELTQRRCDAVVAWEPYASEAIEKSGGHRLFDSSHIPGLCPFGYAFRRKFLNERPDDVQKFVQVWARAVQFIVQNPDEAFAMVARENRKTVAEVRELAEMDKILGLRESKRAFAHDAGFESLHGTARVINGFLLEQGLASRRLDSAEFLDARFLNQLK